MILIRILRRAANMCPAARFIQKLSIRLTCLLLGCAVLLLVRAGDLTVATYRSYRLVYALLETGSAVLLIGVLGAVIIEDRQL